MIESEVNKLPRQLGFLLFDLIAIGGEPERASRRGARFFIRTHFAITSRILTRIRFGKNSEDCRVAQGYSA
jgi:hypothetical protein